MFLAQTPNVSGISWANPMWFLVQLPSNHHETVIHTYQNPIFCMVKKPQPPLFGGFLNVSSRRKQQIGSLHLQQICAFSLTILRNVLMFECGDVPSGFSMGNIYGKTRMGISGLFLWDYLDYGPPWESIDNLITVSMGRSISIHLWCIGRSLCCSKALWLPSPRR